VYCQLFVRVLVFSNRQLSIIDLSFATVVMKNQCAVAVATEVSDLSSLVLKNVSHLLTSAAFKLIFCSCISVEVYQWCTICGLTV